MGDSSCRGGDWVGVGEIVAATERRVMTKMKRLGSGTQSISGYKGKLDAPTPFLHLPSSSGASLRPI